MKKAFTLLELLVVVGLMALLGTMSVGGYHAMQRGMEERGVMQTVNSLIRAAYQRAQIDRQPTAVYFWNETLRESTADENEVVVGKAVAVRRHGRLSNVVGQFLVDEFGDLNLTFRAPGDDDEDTVNTESRIYLYPMERLADIQSSSALRRSIVKGEVVNKRDMPLFLTGVKSDSFSDEQVPAYAFELVDAGGVEWKAGMAYGLEFMQIELPKNYIFGSSYSTSMSQPVQEAGTLTFNVGYNAGGGLSTGGSEGRNTITVYALRPDGATLKAKSVDTTENPEKKLRETK